MTRIDGKAVYLTEFVERHLSDPKYYSWVSDVAVMKYIGRDEYLKPIAFAEVRSYVEGLWKNERATFMAIHLRSNDEFVGTAKITALDPTGQLRGVADIGIMIGARAWWGKGLAADVLRAACVHSVDGLGMRKLTAGAMAPNEAVIRAFKRLGFVEEGRLRRQLNVGGEFIDHVLLGCLASELIRA